MNINNRPKEKFEQSIEIFIKPSTANNEAVKEQLEVLYKHSKVFETSIAQNGVRLLSFEIYGNLTGRKSAVALHRLLLKIIEVEGTAQFRAMDGALFVLDKLNVSVESNESTFKVTDYNANTNVK